jgi:nucleoside-diphosphate-sugar epimerase
MPVFSSGPALDAIVSGASGFVGRALAARVGKQCRALRLGGEDWQKEIEGAALRGATVFHLAARVHHAHDSDAEFERDNVRKTVVLAEAAAANGARRLVFLSSIKVNGEETHDRPFGPGDREAPADAYARSKWAAERALHDIARRTKLSVAIVRSPLVIGDGAGGNLRALMSLADTPWPLPFGALDNRRSFVHVDDLARLLCLCGIHPHADGRVFFAGDPDSVSTARLVSTLRHALGRPARLVALDPRMLVALAALSGQSRRIRPLTRSLEVDASQTERDLGWRPAVPMDDGIAAMARAFRAREDA